MVAPLTQAGEVADRFQGFLECFNRQRYFEAHEVLETVWLHDRGPRRNFYKALIQVAAVFLKLEQGKRDPAARLARRALTHLEPYRPACAGLDVTEIGGWLEAVVRGENRLANSDPPRLMVRET